MIRVLCVLRCMQVMEGFVHFTVTVTNDLPEELPRNFRGVTPHPTFRIRLSDARPLALDLGTW